MSDTATHGRVEADGTVFVRLADGTNLRPEELREEHVLELAPGLDARYVKLAFLFALVGYGTKAGLAPMHAWVPDAYSRAPAPASALLATALSASAIAALLRVTAPASSRIVAISRLCGEPLHERTRHCSSVGWLVVERLVAREGSRSMSSRN